MTIFGTNFKPNAYVTITITKQSENSYTSWNLTSDASGNFTTNYQIDDTGAAQYILTATDGTNTATTTFTDSYALTSISVGPQTPDPITQGSTATYIVTVKFSGNNQANPATLSVTSGLPTGASGSFNPTTIPGNSSTETSTLTITTTPGTTPSGNYTFTVQVVGGGPSGGSLTSSGSLAVTDLSISLSPTLVNMDVGQSQTITSLASGGSGSYSSYKWYVDSAFQIETTTSSFNYSPGSATGAHLITATVTDSSGTTSQLSSPSSIQVNSAPSISTQPTSININNGQSATLFSTVTGGTGSFSWQWYNEDGQISGKSGTGINASYLISGADTGIFVIFTDTGTGSAIPTANAISSPPVVVTVNDLLSISIAPFGPVALAVGQPLTFTAIPFGGSGSYSTYQWYNDGEAVPGESQSTYTFNPLSTDSVSIYATVTDSSGETSFESNTVTVSVNQLAIVVSPPIDGSIISSNGTSVNYGDSLSFSVIPNIGYHITSITVDGNLVTVSSPTGQMVNFANVQTNHTITATFTINTYTLTVSQCFNGQITPGTTNVNYGGTQTFSITADTGYYIVDVTIDGNSVGTVTSFTFTNVQAAYTIAATFAPISSPTPSPSPPPTTTPSPTPAPTPTPTPTSTSTPSPSPAPTQTPNPTNTPNPTPTPTPTPTASPNSTSTPSSTPSPTPSPTPNPSFTETTISVTTKNGEKMELAINGNITLEQMLNITVTSVSPTSTEISFTVTGPSGTVGFSNLTIPKTAIPNGINPVVYIDGNKAPNQGNAQDDNYYYVWYTTHFSTHQVTMRFAEPSTVQVNSSGLILEIVLPITAIILVPTVFVFKRSRKKTLKREIQIEDSTSKSNENKISNIMNANKEATSFNNTPPVNELKEKLGFPESRQKISSKQTANDLKQNKTTGSCNNYFGYLRNLPKGKEIPNECYYCAKLIECHGEPPIPY